MPFRFPRAWDMPTTTTPTHHHGPALAHTPNHPVPQGNSGQYSTPALLY